MTYINVNKKDSQFFIAICKIGAHSYVTVGVQQESGEHVFLGGFGKVRASSDTSCKPVVTFCFELFGKGDAFIQNERVVKYPDAQGDPLIPGNREVKYKAYGITYEQYRQFLAYMAAISRIQTESLSKGPIPPYFYVLSAYVPVEEDENNVRLEWSQLNNSSSLNQPEEVCSDEFSLGFMGNSCRHTGIRLVEVARETSGLGEGVSSMFFKDLPLNAVFGRGEVQETHHFYVLPLPPTAFPDIKGEMQAILINIYNRLDRMVLIAQDNPASIEKFEELKALYQTTAGRGPDNIFDIISSIEDWEAGHKKLIETHRGWHFFGVQTATQKMFNEFHERFARIRENGGAEHEAAAGCNSCSVF